MIDSFREIYNRHLEALHKEISLYQKEEDIWKIDGEILNTAGNLALHLLGNLNYFIGAELGKTGYVRDRDREFSDKGVQKEKLLEMINSCTKMVNDVLSNMHDDQVNQKYPLDKFGEGRSNGYVLAYLLAHFTYHLGQINYHRRLLAV